MRQLALPISLSAEPSLENFVVGTNEELLARIRLLAAGRSSEPVVYLWGAPGSGRSHLLRACARAALSAGTALHTVDDVEGLDHRGAAELFSRINRAREGGAAVLAAGNTPPAGLPLRADVRTRLGGGLVYELRLLDDEDRSRYLREQARSRGLTLSEDVAVFVLSRVRRDMSSLGVLLEEIDRRSLEEKRSVTLPFVRELLADAR